MLRFDTSELESAQGRLRHIPADERLCPCCPLNQVEDSFHFVFECPLFDEPRARFRDKLASITRCVDPFHLRRMSDREKIQFLLGDGPAPSDITNINLQWGNIETQFYHYLATAYKERRRFLKSSRI